MKKFLALAVIAALTALRADETDLADEEDPIIRPGDNVVLIGDSITEQGFRNPWGYYHILTNTLPKVNFIPLGFSGYQVKSWSEMERKSVTEDVWTWYREPGWNLKSVFDGKVDVILIFLGMNDILQPSIHDDPTEIAHWLADYSQFVANLKRRCHPRQILFATITPLTGDNTSPKNRVRQKLNNRLIGLADLLEADIIDFGYAVESLATSCAVRDPAHPIVPDFVHPNDLGHIALAREFCQATGFYEEYEPLTERMVSKLVESFAGRLSLTLELDRCTRPDDDDYRYRIHYATGSATRGLSEVRLILPEGWSADEPLSIDVENYFVIRGRPTSLVTRIIAEATTVDGGASRAVLDLPAPWRVREGDGPWMFYTATHEYTGGMTPGSLDPYQVAFGWKTGTFTATRRIWSEKDRDVKAILSRQGFSETLDLTVKLDGSEVWKDNLNRNERNRIERTLHLKEGWNDLEIVCVHHDWQRQFSFDLEPLPGDSLKQLKYALK